MPYKDPIKQKEAQARYYQQARESYIQKSKDKRNVLRRYIQELKSKSPCVDCKIQYPYYIMDFDHLGEKKFNVGSLSNFGSLEALKEEIAKCEIVCSNCHRHRTWSRLIKTGEGLGQLDIVVK